MNFKVHFTTATLKTLNQHWLAALQKGHSQLLKRITALQLLAEGLRPEPIAQRLAVCLTTVYQWLAGFLRRGFASLSYGKSPGRKAKLDQDQRRHLASLIEAGPQACGFESAIWSGTLLAQLIERQWHLKFHPRYLPALLHQLGFTYQKARFVSDHLDQERRAAWLEQEWPAIVQQAQSKKAWLLFGDEASFAQWGSLAYTWSRRGQQPVVKTSGVRRAYKVFGLVDYFSGQIFYQAQTERFNSQSYCDFVAQVLSRTDPNQPIILVQDGASYHTSRQTREWLEQHSDRLSVYQLPAYSPDFNPIEKLWKKVRRQATHLHYFASFEELVQSVRQELERLSQHSSEVKQAIGSCLDKLVNHIELVA